MPYVAPPLREPQKPTADPPALIDASGEPLRGRRGLGLLEDFRNSLPGAPCRAIVKRSSSEVSRFHTRQGERRRCGEASPKAPPLSSGCRRTARAHPEF